jgi:hypothetical protein
LVELFVVRKGKAEKRKRGEEGKRRERGMVFSYIYMMIDLGMIDSKRELPSLFPRKTGGLLL